MTRRGGRRPPWSPPSRRPPPGRPGPAQRAFDGTYAVDAATGVARIVVAARHPARPRPRRRRDRRASARESETYALLLLAAAGTIVLAGANDLLVLAVGFLLASIPLYGLIGLAHRTPRAAEAAMKTYLLGALSGILHAARRHRPVRRGRRDHATPGSRTGSPPHPPAAVAAGGRRACSPG